MRRDFQERKQCQQPITAFERTILDIWKYGFSFKALLFAANGFFLGQVIERIWNVAFRLMSRSSASGLLLLLVCAAAVCQPLRAGELPRNIRDLKLFRFELDDDSFLGSDDAFSAGWSIQVHSPLLDRWPPGLAGWIGRLPGLRVAGDNGRIVRWSWGITQLIVTPRDVTIAAARYGDAPWAGLLGGYGSWAAYDDRRLAAFQAYIGCVGPCSLAENAQKFVHNDLHFGADPKGCRGSNPSNDSQMNHHGSMRRPTMKHSRNRSAPRKLTVATTSMSAARSGATIRMIKMIASRRSA